MKTVNVHQAKTELSKLLAAVEAGEDVVIARRNKPAVRLVPAAGSGKPQGAGGGDPSSVARVQPTGASRPRVPGRFAHMRGDLPPDLFARPLTKDEVAAWEGNASDFGRP